MGSPITSWEGVEAYFTGYGGFTVGLVLVLSVVATFGALWLGAKHETEAYEALERRR